MIMPANHSSPTVHYFAGKYPGRIGWLVGPSARLKTKLRDWMPYALDNDAFTSFSKGVPWDVTAWRECLKWARSSGKKPLWVLVPDVVSDRVATMERWKEFSPEASAFEWPLAFAVQDGMKPSDVPENANVVFVGGTTEWKWRSLPVWSRNFPRVHVGRVNELRRLWTCEDFGVESVDGTGWFRDSETGRRVSDLKQWLSGDRNETAELFELAPLSVQSL